MAYINQIQIPDLGFYNLYGLDTMVQVEYSNGSQASPSKNLSEALFGSNIDLKNKILNGTAVDAPEIELEKGSLASYIKHIHDIDFKSKKITSLDEFTYKTVVNSPLNITWDDVNKVGLLELNSNSSTQHSIQWSTEKIQEEDSLTFDLPDQTKIRARKNSDTGAYSALILQNVDDDEGVYDTSLIPEQTGYGYLGLPKYKFCALYTNSVFGDTIVAENSINTDTLTFQNTSNSSPIIINQYGSVIDGAKGVVTEFNIGSNSESGWRAGDRKIGWLSANPAGSATTHSLQMRVPNCFSMLAFDANNIESDGHAIVFHRYSLYDDNKYDTVIYPERAHKSSLGIAANPWGQGYFDTLFMNKNINIVGGVAFASGNSLGGSTGIRLSSMENRALTFKDYDGGHVLCTLSFPTDEDPWDSSNITTKAMRCSLPLEVNGDITIKDMIILDVGNNQTIRISYNNANHLEAFLYTGNAKGKRIGWANIE